jgi:orotidine-5'-phosphate decarboxylase
MSGPRLYIALDVATAGEARALARRLAGLPVGLKLGLEVVQACGPALVRELARRAPLFLDLKLHDIPNTVEGAARAVGRLGPVLVTAHALGGAEMLRRAAVALEASTRAAGFAPAGILAVTILTSHDDAAVRDELGLADGGAAASLRLARLALAAGSRGVVCAPTEAAAVRSAVGPDALVVTPGIRPAGRVRGDDQQRVATPAAAIRAGASALVVGRPVTAAPDPRAAARAILDEMEAAR